MPRGWPQVGACLHGNVEKLALRSTSRSLTSISSPPKWRAGRETAANSLRAVVSIRADSVADLYAQVRSRLLGHPCPRPSANDHSYPTLEASTNAAYPTGT